MPLGAPAAALISTGAQQLGQGLFGWIGNKARRKENTLAYERQVEHWNRQNQYNDPSMQMARLKKAGLNPNMVYGTGTQAAGQAGSIGQPPKPEIKDIPVGQTNMIGQYQAIKNAQATENLVRQKLQTEIELAKLTALNAEGQVLTNEQQKLKNDIYATWGEHQAQATYLGTMEGLETSKQKRKESEQNITNMKTINRINLFKEKIEGKNWDWFNTTGVRPNDPLWAKMLTEFITKYANEVKARGTVTMQDIRNEFGQEQINKLTAQERKILNELLNNQ